MDREGSHPLTGRPPGPPSLCVVAGEPSGDIHAGGLAAALSRLAPEAAWFGAGGPALRDAGAEILVPMDKLAVVGISEVLGHLPDLWRAMSTLKSALRERRPDALVLVDYPDFNFRLAQYAKRLGIPVIYYITPQVWAWRPGRVEFLKRHLHRALVILPFEEAYLKERGVDAIFVGHPLGDLSPPSPDGGEFRTRHNIPEGAPYIALCPGSRRSEIRRNLPALVDAADILAERMPDLRAFVPWAPSLQEDPPPVASGSPVRFVRGEYRDVLGHADAAAVASGTACLEAALLAVPQVVVYRLSPLTYAIGRRLVRLPRVALPNVVLGRDAVPELIQSDFTPQKVASALGALLEDRTGAKGASRALAGDLRIALGGGGAYERAAREVIKAVSRRVGE